MARLCLERTAGVLAAAATLCCLSAVASAQISGSAHDFSAAGWNASSEICVVCHTPHNADPAVIAAPLWNHQETTATFTVYSSDTLDASVGQPDGISKLCLSCHDGSVAIDSFAGNAGTTFMESTAPGFVGLDLTDDHPISFVYDDALAALDGGLHPPTTTPSGIVGTIDDDMLFGTKLQCSSCHDPHGVPGVPQFLRISNTGSQLCLTCHDK